MSSATVQGCLHDNIGPCHCLGVTTKDFTQKRRGRGSIRVFLLFMVYFWTIIT